MSLSFPHTLYLPFSFVSLETVAKENEIIDEAWGEELKEVLKKLQPWGDDGSGNAGKARKN